jgi:hypothetical protein
VMPGGVIMRVATMCRPSSIGIAQDDFERAIDRCEHEACRNECPQTKHGQDEWRHPMAHTTVPQPIYSPPHPRTMPDRDPRRKMTMLRSFSGSTVLDVPLHCALNQLRPAA